MVASIRNAVAVDGYAGPFRFCSADHADALARALGTAKNGYFFRDRILRAVGLPRHRLSGLRWGAGRWFKGMFAADALTYDIAAAGPAVTAARGVLGEDVLLSGAILITQKPGQRHAWHVDLEQRSWRGVNVWLALRHVTRRSTLKLIPGSHLYHAALAADAEAGAFAREDDEAVLAAARRYDPRARIRTITPPPGAFIVFDGLAWHSSGNTGEHLRTSLLLQYCRADQQITAPVLARGGRVRATAPAPCVLVSGRDHAGGNLLVERPGGPSLGRTPGLATEPKTNAAAASTADDTIAADPQGPRIASGAAAQRPIIRGAQ